MSSAGVRRLYKPGELHKRRATFSDKNPDGRWRAYTLEEILQRDKNNALAKKRPGLVITLILSSGPRRSLRQARALSPA